MLCQFISLITLYVLAKENCSIETITQTGKTVKFVIKEAIIFPGSIYPRRDTEQYIFSLYSISTINHSKFWKDSKLLMTKIIKKGFFQFIWILDSYLDLSFGKRYLFSHNFAHWSGTWMTNIKVFLTKSDQHDASINIFTNILVLVPVFVCLRVCVCVCMCVCACVYLCDSTTWRQVLVFTSHFRTNDFRFLSVSHNWRWVLENW